MDQGTLRLVTFSFVVSLLFPVFAYAFTSITGADQESFDIVLDENDLIEAGIYLTGGESHNVTFNGGAEEYTVGNQTVRCEWLRLPVGYSRLQVYKQSFIGRVLGNWFGSVLFDLKIGNTIYPAQFGGLENQTIISHFGDDGYNWTMFEIPSLGLHSFISTRPSENNNITLAVETGVLTVTIGATVTELDDWNFRNFLSWYFGIFLGADEWGLPAFMSWLIRIVQGLTLISGILIVKELTRI